VKPWELLGETRTPDGTDMRLQRRDTEYVILAGGLSLMSSRMHGSEEALATRGCHEARSREGACVLIGGLGMGYTLRATLDLLPANATVVVAELVPAVVEWNRGVLAPLADRPLDDPRVQIEMGDVTAIVRAARARFDAVLLDVDNGPNAFTSPVNARLYDDQGLAAMNRALKPGGVVAVWSAWESRRFEQRLKHAGFAVSVDRVRARLKQGGPKHVLFFGRKA
jgi:spermidine synthase